MDVKWMSTLTWQCMSLPYMPSTDKKATPTKEGVNLTHLILVKWIQGSFEYFPSLSLQPYLVGL